MWFNGSCKEYFDHKEKFSNLKDFVEKLGVPKAIDEGIKRIVHQCNWYVEFYEKWHIDVDVHSISYGGGRIEGYGFDCFCGKFTEVLNVQKFVDPMDLMKICFPTGPYIFCHDYYEYLKKHFDTMISEIIKETKPEYFDQLNYALYYRPEVAGAVFAKAYEIFKAYSDSSVEIIKKAKIAELERELKEAKK